MQISSNLRSQQPEIYNNQVVESSADKIAVNNEAISDPTEIQKKNLSSIIKKRLKISGNEAQQKSQHIQMFLRGQIKALTEQMRFTKAVRHINDALYYRTANNELDTINNKVIKLIWRISNSGIWNTVLWLASITYQLLTLFEPPNRKAKDIEYTDTQWVELGIIALFSLDYLFLAIYTGFLYKGFELFDRLMKSKQLIKFLFIIAFMADFIQYNSSVSMLRPTRSFRAFMMVMYSKDLRRNLQGIIKSIKNLLVLFIFYFFVIGVWAYLGTNIFGDDLPGVDMEMMDHTDFFKLFNMLYMLGTMDFYPDMVNQLYLIYFIPYILLFIFLFIPIPLAVVYEGFRAFRVEILINDRIKQKTALFTCFLCMDSDHNGFVSKSSIVKFLGYMYGQQLNQEEIEEFYYKLDINCKYQKKYIIHDSGIISIEEFFTIADVIENNELYHLDRIQPLKIWVEFQTWCNNRLRIKEFVEGQLFTNGIIIMTLINCGLVIAAFFVEDQDIIDTFEMIDKIFFGMYVFEMLVKQIANGLRMYFKDTWNQFDFFLIIFQVLFDFILYDLFSRTLVTSFKANRIVRLAKIQKIFRLFRAFRTVKIFRFFLTGLQVLNDVKNLLHKIIICIPVVMRLLSIVWIMFFVYATVGVEVLSSTDESLSESPYLAYDCDPENEIIYQWGDCAYSSFDTYPGAFLTLLQTLMNSQWSLVVFDIAHKNNDLVTVSIFIGSFVMLQIFVLALISGLIWEIFTIVDKSMAVEDEENRRQDSENSEVVIIEELNSGKKVNIEQWCGSSKKLVFSVSQEKKNPFFQRNMQRGKSQVILEDNNPNMMEFQQRGSLLLRNDVQATGSQPQSNFKRPYRPLNKQVARKVLSEDELSIFEEYKENCSDKFISLQQYRQKNEVGQKKFINGLIGQIRDDLKSGDQNLGKNQLKSHSGLLADAILKNANQDMIKTKEHEHFMKLFGRDYEKVREVNLKQLLNLQSRIQFDLRQVLKYREANLKFMLQILTCLQWEIETKLLRKGSSFKLANELENGKWGVFNMETNGCVINEDLSDVGPWSKVRMNDGMVIGEKMGSNECKMLGIELKESRVLMLEVCNKQGEEQMRELAGKVHEFMDDSYMMVRRCVLVVCLNMEQSNQLNFLPFDYVVEMVYDYGDIIRSLSYNYFYKLQELLYIQKQQFQQVL